MFKTSLKYPNYLKNTLNVTYKNPNYLKNTLNVTYKNASIFLYFSYVFEVLSLYIKPRRIRTLIFESLNAEYFTGTQFFLKSRISKIYFFLLFVHEMTMQCTRIASI